MKMAEYFPNGMQISAAMGKRLAMAEILAELRAGHTIPTIAFARKVAGRLNRLPEMAGTPVSGGLLHIYLLLNVVSRCLISEYFESRNPGALDRAAARAGYPEFGGELAAVLGRFVEFYPSRQMIVGEETPAGFLAGDDPECGRKRLLVVELFILGLAAENQALDDFRPLFDDQDLEMTTSYRQVISQLEVQLATEPPLVPPGLSLSAMLRAPLKASPHSLIGQLEFIRENWGDLLPEGILAELLTAVGIAREEEQQFRGGAGQAQVLEFLKGGRLGRSGYDYPEEERFSPDADWMANVVMLAKMVYVWLGQLARQYGREISRLDQIPDEELDRLARWGFTGLWLIGLWERSPASQKIKQIAGNPDAISSAYSLYDYVIAHDLGGEPALANLKERCRQRGIRLASDMVPNHTGIYSKWVLEHPDWFVQLDYPPYPAYSFNGPDLSSSSDISLQIEDGYWDKRDAAVVFKHHDHRDGRTRYIYHGNDGTSTPWNDTAQLDYLLPQVREAVIQTILHVARQFSIIRFDAAMTLAKKHYQRLWFPQPGHGSGVPSRAEHGMSRDEFDAVFPVEFWREVVDRVAAEAPDTLLLAEAFWLMEGYFVRTLGMHRVYNSAFMNMLKMEENAKYRQTVKNVLEYDHRILPRFVNFMNNPDEKTAVEQFGREGKYFGACALLVTMPGLPMFGHGQVEGFHEKYGMEYRRAYWDEQVDEHLVTAHERLIFPLMRRRWLFSGSENFALYDFFAGEQVDENVFAYSNRAGEERGIVLYNNRFGDTAGWIRVSTAMAREGAALVRTTLGEALGVNPADGCYYVFHDSVSGLEYLRPGRELAEQGLYVELGAYEFRAFLDFREILDAEDGLWGRLCHDLAGRPVTSLTEEIKQLRYAVILEPFRLLLATVPSLPGKTPLAVTENLEPAVLENRLTAFLQALAEHEGAPEAWPVLAAAIKGDLAVLVGLAGTDQPVGELILNVIDGASARAVTLAWLLLHRLGQLAGAGEWAAASAQLVEKYGLLRVVEETLAGIPGEAGATSVFDAVGGVSLLLLAIRWQGFFTPTDEGAQADRLTGLFADQQVREFLLVNESGGHQWFNRERFVLLVHWLYLAAFINAAADDRQAALYGELRQLLTAAENAGYRVDLFAGAAL
jgi:glycosidase